MSELLQIQAANRWQEQQQRKALAASKAATPAPATPAVVPDDIANTLVALVLKAVRQEIRTEIDTAMSEIGAAVKDALPELLAREFASHKEHLLAAAGRILGDEFNAVRISLHGKVEASERRIAAKSLEVETALEQQAPRLRQEHADALAALRAELAGERQKLAEMFHHLLEQLPVPIIQVPPESVRIDQYTTLELPPPVINVPLTVEAILHESPDVEKVKEIEYRPTADGSWLPATIRERRQPLPEEIPTVAETIEALP